MPTQNKSNLIIIAILIILNFIIYFNSINNEFVWDDSYLVSENYRLRDAGSVKKLLTMEDKPAFYQGAGYFRPFIYLTYFIDYQLYNGKAYGFRLTNIGFHIASVIALFYLVLLITDNRLLSTVTASIFSAQAVHVEAVTLIAGRSNVICAFFILLTLYYYVKSVKNDKRNYLFYSMLFLFIAAVSKEFAFVVPFIMIFYDYCFTERFSIRDNAGRYALTFSPLLLYFGYRALFVPIAGAFRLEYATLYLRVINTFKIFVNYIGSQLVPVNLAIYFDLSLRKSFFYPDVILAFFELSAITLLVVSLRKKDKLLFFSFFTYLILLLPVSNVFALPGVMIADRWLYPASAAFALFLARLIFLVGNKKKALIPVITILFTIYLSSYTIKRNHVFKNDFLLYYDAVRVRPESANARNNLGTEFKKRGMYEAAENQFRLAIKYNPKNYLPYNNLGVIYGTKGEYEKALGYFKKSYELKPDYYLSAYNIGLVNNNLGNTEEANRYYERAISLNPDHYDSYINLSLNYKNLGRDAEAIELLKKALEIVLDEKQKEQILNKLNMHAE